MTKRKGRKPTIHTTAWGEQIVGLRRRPCDGRWTVIETRQIFSEADERLAVARFRAMEKGQSRPTLFLQLPQTVLHPILNLTDANKPPMSIAELPEKTIFAWLGEQIRLRPKHVAAMSGIEQIGYLDQLKPPKPLPTFSEMKDAILKHAKCSLLQRKKVVRAWEDFQKQTEIETLTDITADVAISYADAVEEREVSNKQRAHLFAGVRRFLTFAKSRGMAVDEIVRIIEYLKLMRADGILADLNPQPIAVSDYKLLLKASDGHAQNKAMLLLMLNCALYLGETIRLKYEDFKDNCLIARRKKHGRCLRVAPIWEETIEAISKIERIDDLLFHNYRNEALMICGAQRRFKTMAESVGLTLTASTIRDGSYTAAVENNVNSDLCRILVGHRAIGLQDNYVLRNPKMVAPAVEAIHQKYFG